MRQIVCGECRKRYDYDRDDFCPRCGAFNQPRKTWGVDAKGNVIRVDGINERDHDGSFVHQEIHREKDVRRSTGMDWKGTAKRPAAPARRPAAGGKGRPGAAAKETTLAQRIVAIVAAIILINVVLTILPVVFSIF